MRIKNRIAMVGAMIAVTLGACGQETPLQKADSGKIIRHTIYSPELADSMTIDVWLPDDYTSDNKYSVLYMHDGQNLYDAETTWNGQSWEMDATAGKMVKTGEIEPIIIVGVHSDPAKRVSQLMPQRAVSEAGLEELMAEVKLKGEPVLGDAYAEFVVKRLKPMIDATYSTYTDREHTAVMGSSMGGLMSLYLICLYPETFGGAGCMSTHWYGSLDAGDSFGNAMIKFVDNYLPDPESHRIYFDHGTATIDQYYAPWQVKAVESAHQTGYVDRVNLDYMVDEGAVHTETAWAGRVSRPLRFLFGSGR